MCKLASSSITSSPSVLPGYCWHSTPLTAGSHVNNGVETTRHASCCGPWLAPIQHDGSAQAWMHLCMAHCSSSWLPTMAPSLHESSEPKPHKPLLHPQTTQPQATSQAPSNAVPTFGSSYGSRSPAAASTGAMHLHRPCQRTSW